ncbi:hypothetical protein AB1Y20_019004 [Prymnesium parvum]|uniref:3-oxo-5-alpha-steroid 4-dehydrogenase 1 n=1 Tax=Prymnesium parvum TaxID=97485 RepID=A0AB34JU41_PRYPA
MFCDGGVCTEEELHAALGYLLLGSMLMSGVALTCGVVAPYGRYSSVRSFGFSWGRPLPARLAWAVQELPALLIPAALWATTRSSATESLPNRVLLLCFEAHYLNRSVFFPLTVRGGKPTPFGVFLMAFLFCSINAYLQGRYLTKFYTYPETWLTSPLFISGLTVMLFGAAVNAHSDHVLRTLRRPGETGYKIPKGGMFTYVSGANFFGEIVEWGGFAIASGFATPAVIFFVCTAANIGPRALQHHKWYIEKFKEEYTALNRCALIPFVL